VRSYQAIPQTVVGLSPFAIDEIEVVRAVSDGWRRIGRNSGIGPSNEYRRECGNDADYRGAGKFFEGHWARSAVTADLRPLQRVVGREVSDPQYFTQGARISS
jgi:hypothetical protein